MQVFKDAGSQAGVRFPDNLMLPKSDWGSNAPPGADELLVRRRRSFSLGEHGSTRWQLGQEATQPLVVPASVHGGVAQTQHVQCYAYQVKAYRHREGKPDQLLGAAIISLSDLPSDGTVKVQDFSAHADSIRS